jgi:hypothetical protein
MALESQAVTLQSYASLAEIRDSLLETYASNDAMNQVIRASLDRQAWRSACACCPMLFRPLPIAACESFLAAVGRKCGPLEGPCPPTCSRTGPIIAARFLCWRTSSATACCTKLPASGIRRRCENRPASPRTRAERYPHRRYTRISSQDSESRVRGRQGCFHLSDLNVCQDLKPCL